MFLRIANILLRSIKKFHHLLHIEPYIFTLESHINPSDSVFILVNQECLIPFLQFFIILVCHIFNKVFICGFYCLLTQTLCLRISLVKSISRTVPMISHSSPYCLYYRPTCVNLPKTVVLYKLFS